MTVSPQVYIRLQRMETVENCDSCKRLLVFRRVITGEAEDASESSFCLFDQDGCRRRTVRGRKVRAPKGVVLVNGQSG